MKYEVRSLKVREKNKEERQKKVRSMKLDV